MKAMTGTKARSLNKPAAFFLPAQKLAPSEAQLHTPTTALFAEGVDVGIELALSWMETELVGEKSSDLVQQALERIRRLSRQAQQRSLRQQVVRGGPICDTRVRSAAAGQ